MNCHPSSLNYAVLFWGYSASLTSKLYTKSYGIPDSILQQTSCNFRTTFADSFHSFHQIYSNLVHSFITFHDSFISVDVKSRHVFLNTAQHFWQVLHLTEVLSIPFYQHHIFVQIDSKASLIFAWETFSDYICHYFFPMYIGKKKIPVSLNFP